MSKNPTEFKEYAQRWCQTTSQLQSLIEEENVPIFMSTMPSSYYDRLIGHASASFANLVQSRKRIGDDLKTKRSKDY